MEGQPQPVGITSVSASSAQAPSVEKSSIGSREGWCSRQQAFEQGVVSTCLVLSGAIAKQRFGRIRMSRNLDGSSGNAITREGEIEVDQIRP
jgi:hypothetical protein